MGSRLAPIITTLSLALFILTGVGWFRSTFAVDEWTGTLASNFRLISANGAAELRLLVFPEGAPARPMRWYSAEASSYDALPSSEPYDHPPLLNNPMADIELGRFAFKIERWTAPIGTSTSIQFPYWFLFGFFGALPITRAVVRYMLLRKRAKEFKHKFCPHCGYDVIYSREYCPQCGKKLTAKPNPADDKDSVTGVPLIAQGPTQQQEKAREKQLQSLHHYNETPPDHDVSDVAFSDFRK